MKVFVAIWNVCKSCKIWVQLILEFNFWKIEFLEASSPNFPWSSPESVPGSAKITSWTFGIRKIFQLKYRKSAKIGREGGGGVSQNGLVLMSFLPETWNTVRILCEKPFSRHICRDLVQYGGVENEIKWKNQSFLSFSHFLRRNNIQ